MKTVLQVSGSTRDAVNKLMERVGLSTPVPEAAPGVAREFSRANVLEISFRVALMRGGVSAAEAAALAAEWVAKESAGKLAAYWAANPRDVFGHGLRGCTLDFSAGETTAADLAALLPDSPMDQSEPAATLVVINRAEIVRRVDAAADNG